MSEQDCWSACVGCSRPCSSSQCCCCVIATAYAAFPAVLLPGYKVTFTQPGIEPSGLDALKLIGQSLDDPPPPVDACPIGFYYDGSTTNVACVRCPLGSVTLSNGSTSIDDCVVPPGYFVMATTDGLGVMVKCPTTPDGTEQEGYYRSGWKLIRKVASATGDGTDVCTKCGIGILSRAIEPDDSPVAVAGSMVAATSTTCCEYGCTTGTYTLSSCDDSKPCHDDNMHMLVSVNTACSLLSPLACSAQCT